MQACGSGVTIQSFAMKQIKKEARKLKDYSSLGTARVGRAYLAWAHMTGKIATIEKQYKDGFTTHRTGGSGTFRPARPASINLLGKNRKTRKKY